MARQVLENLDPRGNFREKLNLNFEELYALLPTREKDRAASTELLFNKNVIQMNKIVQDGPLTLTIAEFGNLEDQESVIETEIQHNGVDPIYFESDYFSNVRQGEVVDAGTYQVWIVRMMNGRVTVSYVKPSYEIGNLEPLPIPTNFVMVPGAGDPNTQLDATWDLIPNASSLILKLSATGGAGPWTSEVTLAGNATSYTRTGLSSNTTYHQQLTAIGDGENFADSNPVVAAATTQDSGDVTPPVIESSVSDSAIDIPVNKVVVFTSDEALIDADGVTEITNANILDYLTAVNGSAVAQPITATIDDTKKIIAITPDVVWDSLEDITLTLNGVADTNGNAIAAPFAITFTTSDFVQTAGNYLQFSGTAAYTQLSNILTADDANFDIGWTQKNMNLALNSTLFRKHITGERSILCQNGATDNLSFKWYRPGGADALTESREIIWDDVFSAAELDIRIEYRGAIDSGNGLNRMKVFVNGVENTNKTLIAAAGTWPFGIRPSTAPILFGPSNSEVKDIFIRTNNGTVTELFVPNIRTGIDTSGNNRHGAWV